MHVRKGRDPLIALVATMGYSRATFVKFTTDEGAATLCAGLWVAFDYFGAVPEHVLFKCCIEPVSPVAAAERRARDSHA